jgi:hypothetical protein
MDKTKVNPFAKKEEVPAKGGKKPAGKPVMKKKKGC